MEMESWVVEKEVPLERSSSISDHESRLPGHSSKKGLSGWFSCLTFPMSPAPPPPPPPKERRSCSWEWDSEAMVTCPSSCDGSKWEYEKPPCRSLGFDNWYGGKLDPIECHELSVGESMVKPLLLFPDAPEKKLSSPTSDLLAPREYLLPPYDEASTCICDEPAPAPPRDRPWFLVAPAGREGRGSASRAAEVTADSWGCCDWCAGEADLDSTGFLERLRPRCMWRSQYLESGCEIGRAHV